MIEESHRGADRSLTSHARDGEKFSGLAHVRRTAGDAARIGDRHGFQDHSRSD